MLRGKIARTAIPFAAIVAAIAIGVPAWVRAGAGDGPTRNATEVLLDAPPLFTLAGESRDVVALLPGAASAAMTVRDPSTGLPVPIAMRPGEDPAWIGTIPGHLVKGTEVRYSVDVVYPDQSMRAGPSGRMFVLSSIKPSPATAATPSPQTALSLRLGPGEDELGTAGGNESGKDLPASFAVNDGKVYVLDSAKSRVIVADVAGTVVDKLPLAGGTTTASDIAVDGSSGTLSVLDQVNDVIIVVSGKNQTVLNGIGLRGRPLGARLERDPASGQLLVSSSAQGEFLPLLRNGVKIPTADRAPTPGLPTSLGSLAAEVGTRSVTYGFVGPSSHGIRVEFADDVLDASETVVDNDQIVWGLVGVRTSDPQGTAKTLLVRVDPHTGDARSAEVGTSVPGDVTRRLASAGRGVMLLEASGDTVRYVRYETLS